MFRAALSVVALVCAMLSPIAGMPVATAAAQEATPAQGCPAASPEENRAVVRAWYDAIDAGDLDAFDAVFAPVVVQHAADFANARGIEEIKTGFAAFLAAFPDMRHDIVQWVTDGDFVVARVLGQGTHKGEFMGIPATGKAITWTSLAVYRIECGRIAEHWSEVDALGRLHQLGVISPPGAAAGTPAAAATTDAAAASPAAGCPATTEAENETLVRRWYDEVFTRQDLDVANELLAADHLRHGLNRDTVGAAARIAAVQTQQTALPDASVAPDFLLTSGDLVVARWTATGTHDGPWESVPATGNPVTWTGNTIFRIACGRIAEEWAEVDTLAFFQQIGAIAWPPTQGEASPAAS